MTRRLIARLLLAATVMCCGCRRKPDAVVVIKVSTETTTKLQVQSLSGNATVFVDQCTPHETVNDVTEWTCGDNSGFGDSITQGKPYPVTAGKGSPIITGNTGSITVTVKP